MPTLAPHAQRQPLHRQHLRKDHLMHPDIAYRFARDWQEREREIVARMRRWSSRPDSPSSIRRRIGGSIIRVGRWVAADSMNEPAWSR